MMDLRWKILVLRYLKRLLPDSSFLTNEADKLEKDMSKEIQRQYNTQPVN